LTKWQTGFCVASTGGESEKAGERPPEQLDGNCAPNSKLLQTGNAVGQDCSPNPRGESFWESPELPSD
jgi:hypothetical protein